MNLLQIPEIGIVQGGWRRRPTHTPFGTEEKIEPWEGSLVAGYSDLHLRPRPSPNTKTIQRGRYAVHNWKNIKQTYKNHFFSKRKRHKNNLSFFLKKRHNNNVNKYQEKKKHAVLIAFIKQEEFTCVLIHMHIRNT